jgi:hypothetical protein
MHDLARDRLYEALSEQRRTVPSSRLPMSSLERLSSCIARDPVRLAMRQYESTGPTAQNEPP